MFTKYVIVLLCCGIIFPAALASGGLRADHSPVEDDWWLPEWVQPTANSGFFSEEMSAAYDVNLAVVDLTWRQLQPIKGTFSTTTTDSVYGMTFNSWNTQLGGTNPFWMRLWISGEDWAPQWMQTECGVSAVDDGYENDPQLPIWNPCMWQYAKEFYREVLLVRGLRSDPRLKFIYVPGAFTWCEFDYDIIDSANQQGILSFNTFNTWYQQAITDLITIMNGENADPSDDYAYKLVFTGEDYPFGPFDAQDDLLARDAVEAGMGIRTGITELFNFHLSDIPAYGTRISQDGHMVTDETWPLLTNPESIIATENECYNDCGFSTTDIYYAVKMSNLKALQMRVNWLYVVPGPSYMSQYAPFWNWIRLSLGKTATTSADAWVALREAEDRYWIDDDAVDWPTRPWVRNMERWLVQREVSPDGLTVRGSDVRSAVLEPDNGTAYEGRATHMAASSDYIYFDIDDAFLHRQTFPVTVKITFLDIGSTPFYVEYTSLSGLKQSQPLERSGSGQWKTVSLTIIDGYFDDSMSQSTDFRIYNGGAEDIEVRFVRVIKNQTLHVVGNALNNCILSIVLLIILSVVFGHSQEHNRGPSEIGVSS